MSCTQPDFFRAEIIIYIEHCYTTPLVNPLYVDNTAVGLRAADPVRGNYNSWAANACQLMKVPHTNSSKCQTFKELNHVKCVLYVCHCIGIAVFLYSVNPHKEISITSSL